MTKTNPEGGPRWEELAMKAVDGQLDDAERAELDALLAESPERRGELADYLAINEATSAVAARIRADADLEPVRERDQPKAVVGLGMVLAVLGLVLVTGWGLVSVMTADDTPLAVRVGVATATAGALLLLGYLVGVRLRARGRDPYEEIDL